MLDYPGPMSKHKIVLIRHAKAEQQATGGDVHRALSERGRKQSAELADKLKSELTKVGAVLVSPAARAKETWSAIAQALPEGMPAATVVDDIYSGDPMDIIEAVRMEAAGETTIVVGHEPTISEAARLLAKDPSALPWGVPTATAIILSASHDWKEWHSGIGEDPQVVLTN